MSDLIPLDTIRKVAYLTTSLRLQHAPYDEDTHQAEVTEWLPALKTKHVEIVRDRFDFPASRIGTTHDVFYDICKKRHFLRVALNLSDIHAYIVNGPRESEYITFSWPSIEKTLDSKPELREVSFSLDGDQTFEVFSEARHFGLAGWSRSLDRFVASDVTYGYRFINN